MAERPIFVPVSTGDQLVSEIYFSITWHAGFAPSQKKRNVKALHQAAQKAGYSPILEISTKSEDEVGQCLSAFNLRIHSQEAGDIPLECAFQGGKVFEHGGPYKDLYWSDPRAAKRDPRLGESGKLVGFSFEDFLCPIEPKLLTMTGSTSPRYFDIPNGSPNCIVTLASPTSNSTLSTRSTAKRGRAPFSLHLHPGTSLRTR
jgi:hypothetical protein